MHPLGAWLLFCLALGIQGARPQWDEDPKYYNRQKIKNVLEYHGKYFVLFKSYRNLIGGRVYEHNDTTCRSGRSLGKARKGGFTLNLGYRVGKNGSFHNFNATAKLFKTGNHTKSNAMNVTSAGGYSGSFRLIYLNSTGSCAVYRRPDKNMGNECEMHVRDTWILVEKRNWTVPKDCANAYTKNCLGSLPDFDKSCLTGAAYKKNP